MPSEAVPPGASAKVGADSSAGARDAGVHLNVARAVEHIGHGRVVGAGLPDRGDDDIEAGHGTGPAELQKRAGEAAAVIILVGLKVVNAEHAAQRIIDAAGRRRRVQVIDGR